MEKVRTLWPEALKDLPMDEDHKNILKAHWLKLQPDFRIDV
jgi:serine/threonine-protein kinase HipA